MKKYIGTKMYDTSSATRVASWNNDCSVVDFDYISETLYRKRTGEYFLVGEGGTRTKYAQARGSNSWVGGSRLMPLSHDEARSWAEEHLTGEEVEQVFETLPEYAANMSIWVSGRTKALIDAEARRTGHTIKQVVDDCIEAQLG